MAIRQPTTDEICNGWLHNALDEILACPYDYLKIAIGMEPANRRTSDQQETIPATATSVARQRVRTGRG
jgi:hypothetical protein